MTGANRGALTPAPYTEHNISVEGHKLALWAFNAGVKTTPPIVFIHGITASNAMWLIGQTPHVKAHYAWYALSLPGHYPAELPTQHRADEINAATHARIMAQAIQQVLGDVPVILAGHSTGGFAALNIAANAPDALNVAGVISISGFMHGRWTGTLGILQALARGGPLGRALFGMNIQALGLSKQLFKFAIGLYSHDRAALYTHPAAEPTFDAMFPYVQQVNADAMRQYFYRMPKINISADVSGITVPTLVIAGARDPVVPPEQSRRIAGRVAGAELVMMPNVGHLPMSERGDDYNHAITDWLERHFE